MIIGLDISTSCIGWAVLDGDGELVAIGHINFKDANTLWEKADKAMEQLGMICDTHGPTAFYIEESLQGFRPGLSSASTLLTLAKFNGLLSFFMRQKLGRDPVYIPSAKARKLCGIKLLQKNKHPHAYGHKEQTFEAISGGLLAGHSWKEKRNAPADAPLVRRVVDSAMDEVDAFVIARAGWLMNTGRDVNKDSAECLQSPKRSDSSKRRSVKAT